MSRDNNRGIDRWETEEVIFSDDCELKNATIGVSLQINRPIFTDGNRGYPKLSATISRDKANIRFPFFDGNDDEIQALRNLILKMLEHVEAGKISLNDLLEQHRTSLKMAREEEIECAKKAWSQSDQFGHDDRVNKGLGKFSRSGKTERKRRSRSSRKNQFDDGSCA